MKKTLSVALATAALLVFATSASAQTTLASQNVIAQVTVGNQARLTVAGGPITFADSDPDTVPVIAAGAPVTVAARARVAPATQLNVTVSAGAAFFDAATSTIPVTALEWTVAGGAAFVGGAMDTTEQTVAQWNGPANQNGTQNYTLNNAWTYAPGVHSVTLTYTLSTP